MNRSICLAALVVYSLAANPSRANDIEVKINTGAGLKEVSFQRMEPAKAGVSEQKTLGVLLSAAGDKACEEIVLGELSGWPESKVEMELSCVEIPFLGRVCTDLPRVYARECTKRIVAQVCYPSGSAVANTAKNCAVAGAGAAVAACIAGGCGAAAPAFEAGAKACLAVSAPDLVNDLGFSLTERTDCGGWHPV